MFFGAVVKAFSGARPLKNSGLRTDQQKQPVVPVPFAPASRGRPIFDSISCIASRGQPLEADHYSGSGLRYRRPWLLRSAGKPGGNPKAACASEDDITRLDDVRNRT
jgi:hypothetical protein